MQLWVIKASSIYNLHCILIIFEATYGSFPFQDQDHINWDKMYALEIGHIYGMIFDLLPHCNLDELRSSGSNIYMFCVDYHIFNLL